MALIKCSECGKDISDSAVSCPHCGCKTSRGETVTQAKVILIQCGFAIGIMAFGIIMLCSGLSFINEYRSDYWGRYLWKEGYWTDDSEAVIAVIKVVGGIGTVLGALIDMFIIHKKIKEVPSAPVKTIATMQGTSSQNARYDNYPTQNVPQGSWTCKCGKVHPTYVSSCSCGINKRDLL